MQFVPLAEITENFRLHHPDSRPDSVNLHLLYSVQALSLFKPRPPANLGSRLNPLGTRPAFTKHPHLSAVVC